MPNQPSTTEKVTFYLSSEQVMKLEDLTYQLKKETRKRLNRNDIVRALIDHATLDQLRGVFATQP
jgi:hypothetical protein